MTYQTCLRGVQRCVRTLKRDAAPLVSPGREKLVIIDLLLGLRLWDIAAAQVGGSRREATLGCTQRQTCWRSCEVWLPHFTFTACSSHDKFSRELCQEELTSSADLCVMAERRADQTSSFSARSSPLGEYFISCCRERQGTGNNH